VVSDTSRAPGRSSHSYHVPRITYHVLLFCVFTAVCAADSPRGFFIEDLQQKPPSPAFYNLETHRLEPFALQRRYIQFIEFFWDQTHNRVFFSARESKQDPFRIYVKEWPGGDEKSIYENPLGPFRFLVSPDGKRLALQIMGPWTWPTFGVYDWQDQQWTALGQGYSPDWSNDGQRLLYLHLSGGLPSWLYEYAVEQDTATLLIPEPVVEAAYTDDNNLIVVKTQNQTRRCDVFQLWNRQTNKFSIFSPPAEHFNCKKTPVAQRELGSFPGHRFLFFKETPASAETQDVIVSDVWGQRLQTLSQDDWDPQVVAEEETVLAMGEDPLYIVPADGAGGRTEIAHAGFIRVHH
jgi:hypothetical protein